MFPLPMKLHMLKVIAVTRRLRYLPCTLGNVAARAVPCAVPLQVMFQNTRNDRLSFELTREK